MPAPFSGRRNRGHRAFTLVELLSIIAVIAVLLPIMARIDTGFFRGNALETSADLLRQALADTRETATHRSQCAYLVIRTSGPDAWRRFAIFAKSPENGQWLATSAWSHCLGEARVDAAFTIPPQWGGTTSLADLATKITPPTEAIYDGGTRLTYESDYLAIGFLPGGRLVSDENVAVRITTAQGRATPRGTILVTEGTMGRVKILREE